MKASPCKKRGVKVRYSFYIEKELFIIEYTATLRMNELCRFTRLMMLHTIKVHSFVIPLVDGRM